MASLRLRRSRIFSSSLLKYRPFSSIPLSNPDHHHHHHHCQPVASPPTVRSPHSPPPHSSLMHMQGSVPQSQNYIHGDGRNFAPSQNYDPPGQSDGRGYGSPPVRDPSVSGERRDFGPAGNRDYAFEGRENYQGDGTDPMPSYQNYNQGTQGKFVNQEGRDLSQGERRNYLTPERGDYRNAGSSGGGDYRQGAGSGYGQSYTGPGEGQSFSQADYIRGVRGDPRNFSRMGQRGTGQDCVRSGSLIQGKLIHGHIIKTSFKPCLFLHNNLLNMYCKCGDMGMARQLFDRMPIRNIISWNSLITGYSQMGVYDEAMKLFFTAREIPVVLDRFTYACVLNICAQTGDLRLGMIIHGLVVGGGFSSKVFLINSLIDMYAKSGRMDQARLLFDISNELDDVSWNSLVAGYVRIGSNEETLNALVQMHQSGVKMNSFALGSAIKACSNSNGLEEFGKMIHGCGIKIGLDFDVFVGSAMLDMYAKCGKLHDAVMVFKFIPEPNVVVLNAMIAGFFRSEVEICDEFANEALNLFFEMRKRGLRPSKFTFSSILRACSSIGYIECGKQIHAQIFKNSLQSDEFIGSALIDLYSKSGLTEDGLRCFNAFPKDDVVTWTSMIAGCVQNGLFEQALILFHQLLIVGQKPDQFTISSAFSACANLAVVRSGEQIQGYAMKAGFDCFTIIRNSQISMYAKSGDLDAADRAFYKTENRDVVSWSVMISSHAQHGCAREALRLFEEMKCNGVEPNHITFLGALTACSHGGLLDEGFRYFESMQEDYKITPNLKHCACIVDLLGRSGKLSEAECFIANSGFEDDPVMWRALLGACRIHGDTKIGKRVAERVIELEPEAAASYVLLYNMYLDAGNKSLATRVRDLMKDKGIKKEPGLSWIEIGTDVHSFVVGDKSHPQTQLIYEKLEEMFQKIDQMNYDNFRSSVVDEPSQEHKENSTRYHSEKLAVALGMIALPRSAPVRVMKNLRVCLDCHSAMKLFSKVERREIILRDTIRFHRFREGSCNCGDYW